MLRDGHVLREQGQYKYLLCQGQMRLQ